jgi:hypothetical protein
MISKLVLLREMACTSVIRDANHGTMAINPKNRAPPNVKRTITRFK